MTNRMRRWAVAALALAVLLVAPAAWADAPAAGGPYIDAADGYLLLPPPGWQFDGSLLPDVVRWNTAAASLRVYLQPVASPAAAATYVSYSNRSIDEGWNGIQLLDHWQSGTAWYRHWLRPAMPLMQPDMREYAEWDTLIAPDRVLTIMVNATPAAFPQALAAGERALASAAAFTPSGSNAFALPHAAARAPQLVPPAGTPLQWGLFEPKVQPEHPDLTPVLAREAQIGGPVGLVMVYLGFGQPFPAALLQQAAANGQKVELTLQSWSPWTNADRSLPYTHGTSADGAILQGQYDSYLRQFAADAAATGIPFFLRFDNEMNGDWDPWSAFQWGKDTDIYVAAWRHVYSIFQQAGATDAVWVWNPNNDNLPAYRWNDAALYYPGDAYVDWVGLTAYNLGTGQPGSAWRSFDQAYRATYERDLQLYPGKPLIITEFASNDQGGDKPAWIRDMFAALPSYPAIRYAVWWDSDQGQLQYRLDQPSSALTAFRTGFMGAP